MQASPDENGGTSIYTTTATTTIFHWVIIKLQQKHHLPTQNITTSQGDPNKPYFPGWMIYSFGDFLDGGDGVFSTATSYFSRKSFKLYTQHLTITRIECYTNNNNNISEWSISSQGVLILH